MRQTQAAQTQLDLLEDRARDQGKFRPVAVKFGRTNLVFGVVALGLATDGADPVKESRKGKGRE